MSYILEALKKAQAERQLGNTPTIHATQAAYLAPLPSRFTPLLIGAAAGVVALGLIATLAWRHFEQQEQEQERLAAASTRNVVEIIPDSPAVTEPPAPVTAMNGAAPGPAPAAPAAPVPATPASRAQPAAWSPANVAQPSATATPAPAARARDAVSHGVTSAGRQPGSNPPAVQDTPARAPAPLDTVRTPATGVAAAAPYAGPDDDYVHTLAELPEAVRRELPQVVFGGYMYSPNPADRLILVDKVLRTEGDEVAPGLKLEKLLPKAAVLKYKGYRYRVTL